METVADSSVTAVSQSIGKDSLAVILTIAHIAERI